MSLDTVIKRTETLNGTRLYFEVHGNGEPLLLLHGFGGCAQDWIDAAYKNISHAAENSSSALLEQWGREFQIVLIDMRGHGRSFAFDASDHTEARQVFRHIDAAADVLALLDYLGIKRIKAVGISAGGNVLLHLATRQPDRVAAIVLVSATSYFPAQARPIMRSYGENPPAADLELMRRRHPRGQAQINALLASTKSFADSYDDMNFTPPYLAMITARTLIIQGDRDPLYPLEISVEMARAIPRASLWIVPNAGHGPVAGERWPEFVSTAVNFLGD